MSEDHNNRWLEICRQLRCPTCINLDLCTSENPQSLAMKKDILNRFAYQTNQEIIEEYIQKYSTWILTAPPKDQWSYRWLWWTPILFLLLGLWRIHRMHRPSNMEKNIYDHH